MTTGSMITTTKCKGEQGNEKVFPSRSNGRVSCYFSSKEPFIIIGTVPRDTTAE